MAAAVLCLAGCLAPAPKTAGTDPTVRPGTASRPRPDAEQPATVQDAGWQFPVRNAVLPTEPELLPNAERGYRGGIHQGVDLFYARQEGELLGCGESVVNARTGTVIRADRDWVAMTVREYNATTAALRAAPAPGMPASAGGMSATDEERLDRLRGRQVWVSCDDGVVIRYCHLEAVDASIEVGLKIAHGIVIGRIGNSGTADGASGSGKNCHLHFEVWPTPDTYLGKGLSARAARREYAKLFGLP